MSTAFEYQALVDSWERQLNLPIGVLAAIIQQESGGDPFAMRFEPDFFRRYLMGKSKAELGGAWPGGATEATERYARAMSWGLMQILGQTARELGFAATFLSELCKPDYGIQFGAQLLSNKLKRYGTIQQALSAYNAGAPTEDNMLSYVGPILARVE